MVVDNQMVSLIRYNLAEKRYDEDVLPYKVKRMSYFGVPTEEVVISESVAEERQFKVLFARFFTEYAGGVVFKVEQTGGDVGGSPDGVVDYVFLEGKGVEILQADEGIVNPVYVMEGTVKVSVIAPAMVDLNGEKFGVVLVGVENERYE